MWVCPGINLPGCTNKSDSDKVKKWQCAYRVLQYLVLITQIHLLFMKHFISIICCISSVNILFGDILFPLKRSPTFMLFIIWSQIQFMLFLPFSFPFVPKCFGGHLLRQFTEDTSLYCEQPAKVGVLKGSQLSSKTLQTQIQCVPDWEKHRKPA